MRLQGRQSSFHHSEVLCQAENAPNLFSADAPPRTPLGELTTLPQTPNRLVMETPLPIAHSTRRLRRLDLFPLGKFSAVAREYGRRNLSFRGGGAALD